MGVAQGALNGLVGTIGVGATMLSRSISSMNKQSGQQAKPTQSQAINAQKNQQAYQNSMKNMMELQELQKSITAI